MENVNEIKKGIKRQISILENRLNRYNDKQEEKWELLKQLSGKEHEKKYFEELKKLESIQEQMETTEFELNELKDELAELE